jgi:hypothetical protein
LSYTHHNFIVINANYVGDMGEGVQVISYGRLANGNMGRVFQDVNEVDSGHWASLATEETTASYRVINADDSVVLSYVNRLVEDLKYAAIPQGDIEVLGTRNQWVAKRKLNDANSNSGAGAVANISDGGSTSVNNNAAQPGHGQSSRVSFRPKTNSDNGMSGGKTRICSGMGAQKGGCKK